LDFYGEISLLVENDDEDDDEMLEILGTSDFGKARKGKID
jgi:hypothetical protein